jgi:glycosyltransferase involved in cell wall biosynthesis
MPPTVSVSLITYNHERYVGAAIRSVLGQTLGDLEVIVVDDGSTDGTPAEVARFTDPRVVSVRQENQGPSAATNRAVAAARGRYLAFMSGDDLCHPDRLARQVAEYERGAPGMLFSAVDFIDEDGRPLERGHYACDLFDTTPRTRAQALAKFFHDRNYINSITGFTETRLFRENGPYDPRLYQLQDFDMWVRVVKRYDLRFLQQPTVHYRIRAGQQNLSAPTPGHVTRALLEYYLVLRRFFGGVSPDLFREAFGDRLRHPECPSPHHVACEQALLYLESPHRLNQLIGVERLYELLGDPDSAAVLAADYDLPPARFADRLRTMDILDLYPMLNTVLYIDTGDGFTEARACVAQTRLDEPAFRLEFDLRPYDGIRALRWDPVSLRMCRLRLDEVVYNEGGVARPLDPSAVETNGRRLPDGRCEFETAGPMVFLPVVERPERLALCGRLEVRDQEYTLRRQYSALVAKEQEALARERALQAREHELTVYKHKLEVCEDRLQVRERELEVRGQQLLAHRHELHAHQRALQDHQDELRSLRHEYHALRHQLQSILDSRGYRLLERARRVARRLRRAG